MTWPVAAVTAAVMTPIPTLSCRATRYPGTAQYGEQNAAATNGTGTSQRRNNNASTVINNPHAIPCGHTPRHQTARVRCIPHCRQTGPYRYDMPSSSRTWMNPATARRTSSSECAADSCTRMRALSLGTTGYENAMT